MRIVQEEFLKDVKVRIINNMAEKTMIKRLKTVLTQNDGMELVQVAILVALAIGLGLIFKSRITEFVTVTFDSLMSAGF